MQNIPVFDEFGFMPSPPSISAKFPTWGWIIIGVFIGGLLSFFIFKPKEKKINEPVPQVNQPDDID